LSSTLRHQTLTQAGGGCKLETMEKIQIHQQGFAGMVWIAAWLFTIGFLHLPFWKGVFAVVLWPYYLGLAFGK
jgi:hypothetical protein